VSDILPGMMWTREDLVQRLLEFAGEACDTWEPGEWRTADLGRGWSMGQGLCVHCRQPYPLHLAKAAAGELKDARDAPVHVKG
jgi:hypothetical protein